MEVLSGQVLHEFGVKAKKIVKEKSYYICSTDKGMRVVKKTGDSKDRVIFQHEIKEHLFEAGFRNTDRFCLTVKKQPYFEYIDETYVMTELLGQREVNFADNAEFKKIIEVLAHIHKLTSGINFTSKIFYGETDLLEEYKKNISAMQLIKKRVSSQKRLSDFDVIFLKNYEYYLSRLKASVQGLERMPFQQYVQNARESKSICHNLLKEENILTDSQNMYITGFSRAAVGYRLIDLAELIRRYAKSAPEKALSVREILDQYNSPAPISPEEIEMLYYLLKYPSKFLRICDQYYSKKRTWTPSAIISRMEKIIEDRDRYEEFVEGIL